MKLKKLGVRAFICCCSCPHIDNIFSCYDLLLNYNKPIVTIKRYCHRTKKKKKKNPAVM